MRTLLPTLRTVATSLVLALTVGLAGCGDSSTDTAAQSSDITDVKHTDVERQSIGNCWLYAEASWVESMNLSATGKPFDLSQSYWTYWHWFDQITNEAGQEIQTGGSFGVARDIVTSRGLMAEADFVAEDATAEMSTRQSAALAKMNEELKTGRLSTYDAKNDLALVRQVLDEAWQLKDAVRDQLTKVFGEDYSRTLSSKGASTEGTAVVAARDFVVRYTERSASGDTAVRDTTLDKALSTWRAASYPTWGGESARRDFQIRVQRALHDAQPVVITWDVDFNAMEGWDPELKGSFNLTTLKKAGKPGHQGGHMTVLEDYEAVTQELGTLEAGVTLDPAKAEDKARLDAALLPSTAVKFFRIKNSWGALRDDRSSAPGFPGYHDLYMDYLNGPIAFCPDAKSPTNETCTGTTVPLDSVVLPPGY